MLLQIGLQLFVVIAIVSNVFTPQCDGWLFQRSVS
jgi:hypothetical protein